MADETKTAEKAPEVTVTVTKTAETKPAVDADEAARKARKKARKELREIHLKGGPEKAGVDPVRFHELHYQGAGKAIPSPDPDDLD